MCRHFILGNLERWLGSMLQVAQQEIQENLARTAEAPLVQSMCSDELPSAQDKLKEALAKAEAQ